MTPNLTTAVAAALQSRRPVYAVLNVFGAVCRIENAMPGSFTSPVYRVKPDGSAERVKCH